MRKMLSLISATLVAGLIAGGGAWAFGPPYLAGPLQASNLLGALNSIIQDIQTYTGLVAALPGTVASSATTVEQTFATTTIPTGTLALPGQTLIMRCAGTTGANTNNKTAHLYWGAYEFSTATMSTSAESWELEMTVTAATAASATANNVIYSRGTTNTTVVAPTVTNDFVDLNSGGVTVKCTGTQGTASAADMTMYDFIVFQEK